MDDDQEVYVIEVESKLQVVLILVDAYRLEIITRQELINCLVDILYQT